MSNIWHRLFLCERPSMCLAAFRIAVALTVGAVILPTFVHLDDTYLSTAFKTFNPNFFPIGILEWISQSPDWVVKIFVGVFCLSWLMFLVGLFSQISCIVMVGACYYFYALNAFAMGTLTWDILLVTLFLMCITNYHGDYFSLDALRRGDENAYRKCRPYFLQRLFQLQIGFTFFYTALNKVTSEGNWLSGNPIYALMNYPHEGVVKYFILKDYLMHMPKVCYVIGVSIVVIELLMIFLLFWHRTRVSAIYLGCFFHILLILTLDVPATFFFLFPPMLLLFINPEKILEWIDSKRKVNNETRMHKIIYDGKCLFCRASIHYLKIMDLFGCLQYVDLHTIANFKDVHHGLSKEKTLEQVYLLSINGGLYGGFYAFQRMTLLLPMMYGLAPIFYFPGVGVVGSLCYRFIAKNRYLIPLPSSGIHVK